MGSAIKGIGSAVSGVAGKVAPIAGMINPMVGAGLAGIGALGAMGGFSPQIGQAGGGAASGVGDQYSQYLGGFMQNGGQNQQQMNQALMSMLSGRPGDPTNLQGYFNAGMGQNGQAQSGQSGITPIHVGYTPQDVNTGIQSQNVQGNWNPQNIPQQFSGMNVSGGFNPQQMNAQYNPQNINFSAPQYQTPGLNTNLQTNINANGISQVNAPNAQFQAPGNIPNVLQGMGQQANLGQIVNPQANVDAMQQVMQNQQKMDIAGLRERFGNQALSSGAQLAESQYRAQAAPQQALALDQITRANNEQALTQRGQDLSNFQGSRGLDVQQLGLGSNTGLSQANMANQFNLQNAGMNLQGQGMNQQAGISQLQAQLQAAGLSNEAILGLNNQFLNQSGQANTFNQQNAQQQMQGQLANSQNQQFGAQFQQQNQSLNNQYAQQAAAQQLQAMLANQQNQQFGANYAQQGQIAQNQFGQANAAQQLQAMLANQNAGLQASQLNQQGQIANNQSAQFGANLGLQQGNMNNQNMMQNQQMGNQWNLGLQNAGIQQQQIQAQSQQAALQQLMAALGQTQHLGTAQAETTVAPSWGSQLLGGVGALGGAYSAWNNAQNAAPNNSMGMTMPQFGALPPMANAGVGLMPMGIPQGMMQNFMQPRFMPM